MRSGTRQAIALLIRALRLSVPLDVWLWLPGGLYTIWMAWRLVSSIVYPSTDYTIEMVLLFFAPLMVFFLCVAFVDGLLTLRAPRLCRAVYVGFVHLFLALMFIDSILYQLMSLHLPRAIAFLFDGGPSHVAMNWAQIGVSKVFLHKTMGYSLFVILCVTVYSWAMTGRSKRPKLLLSPGSVALMGLGYCAAYCAGSRIASAGGDEYWNAMLAELKPAIPFGLASVTPDCLRRFSVHALRPIRGKEEIESAFQRAIIKDGPHPDIFIFVLESFRGDFVSAQVTPNLNRYALDCLKFPDSLSAGNASHIAWYSFLMANYGLYYGEEHRFASHAGSVPIASLRRMGYKVNVLCSATLAYFDIAKIAFGNDLKLCDSMFDAEKSGIETRPERDLEVKTRLLQAIDGPAGGRLFLVFFDSTHHDYEWPPGEPTPFVPFAQTWNYFDLSISDRQLTAIMNRYKNSLRFQDRLLGEIFSAMRRNGLYDKSVIAAFGDHGEEFMEHGRLTHASNLFRPQTHVPFLLKLPTGAPLPGNPNHRLSTGNYLDLFPTLLDYLGVNVTNAFDGTSLFRKTNDYVIITAQNGGFDPVGFCIQSARFKAFFHYEFDDRPTADQRTLFLTGLTDTNDATVNIEIHSEEGKTLLSTNFDAAFETLYGRGLQ
jgi:membrane-anchored protein YejM (alkaline phosphatase superfamily)